MKPAVKTLLYIAAGAAAIFALTRLSLKKNTVFLLQGVKVTGGVLSPRLLVTFIVQNPTRQVSTFKSFSGQLLINEKYIGNVSAFGDQVIKPLGESFVNITVRPSMLSVFSSINDFLNTPGGGATARVTGTANIDGFTVPVNETLNL